MKNYVIITDSMSDLPDDIAKKFEIEVIPVEFLLDEKNYLNYSDNRELAPEKFYQMIREGKSASTSQINMERFLNVFEPLLKSGNDIIYISFSSALSGTYNSAILAAKELQNTYKDQKIFIVDSLSASMGEALLVYYAALKKQDGFSIDQLKNWLEENKLNICHWVAVEDLSYLKKGGRISPSAAFLGTMLNIKPVLHVNDEGKLIPFSKIRGRKQSIEELFNKMQNNFTNHADAPVFISHADCEEDALFLK